MQPQRFADDFALFLDVDGTLIEIASHPDAVVVPPSLLHDLEIAERRLGGALALVSGRTIADLDRLFAPLRLKASGVHGAEFRFSSDQEIATPASEMLPWTAWTDLEAILQGFPGSLAENKAFSFAVHYRAIPESGPLLRQSLEDFVSSHPELMLRIMPGHYVFELKRTDFDKGAAIHRFMQQEPFSGRRPAFFGDDITDLPGFEAALARNGLAFSVGINVPNVSGTFSDPAAVRHWLSELIHQESTTV